MCNFPDQQLILVCKPYNYTMSWDSPHAYLTEIKTHLIGQWGIMRYHEQKSYIKAINVIFRFWFIGFNIWSAIEFECFEIMY